jgi:mRNA-degrading endonuclease toxin of MazEF toxin-antitoxin module
MSVQPHSTNEPSCTLLRPAPTNTELNTTEPEMFALCHLLKTQRRAVPVKRPLNNRLAYVDALVGRFQPSLACFFIFFIFIFFIFIILA